MVVGAQLHQQIEDFVNDLGDAFVGAINLVDDHHRLQAQLQSLAQHELGLGHHALGGVDQQAAAVGHAQHALDFATKVGVARGVEDVDAIFLAVERVIGHGAVLGEDGDPAFAFERVGVHDEPVLAALELLQLAGTKVTGLLEQVIDQGGLTMVDVGDDGHIADALVARDVQALVGRVLRGGRGGGGCHWRRLKKTKGPVASGDILRQARQGRDQSLPGETRVPSRFWGWGIPNRLTIARAEAACTFSERQRLLERALTCQGAGRKGRLRAGDRSFRSGSPR